MEAAASSANAGRAGQIVVRLRTLTVLAATPLR